jgi:hypothetical protein
VTIAITRPYHPSPQGLPPTTAARSAPAPAPSAPARASDGLADGTSRSTSYRASRASSTSECRSSNSTAPRAGRRWIRGRRAWGVLEAGCARFAHSPRHTALSRVTSPLAFRAASLSGGAPPRRPAGSNPGSVAWMLLDEGFSGITDGDLRMRPTVVVHPRRAQRAAPLR